MSQLQRPYNSTAASNVPPGEEENWGDLLANLTVFITASANLVNSLKSTIEVSKLQSGEGLESELLCSCPKITEVTNQTSPPPTTTTSPTPAATPFIIPQIDTSASENQKTEAEETAENLNTAFFGDLPVDNDNVQVIQQPKNCMCKSQTSTSTRGSVRSSKSKTSTRKCDKLIAKEKAEKLLKLKEDVNMAQKNLANIQEQVRQLERLYQDYDSPNTPDGQLNPAKLYKEIMKPQTVPYICTAKTPMPQKTSQKSFGSTACECLSYSTPSKAYSGNVQDRVSVLSAVPLDQGYY